MLRCGDIGAHDALPLSAPECLYNASPNTVQGVDKRLKKAKTSPSATSTRFADVETGSTRRQRRFARLTILSKGGGGRTQRLTRGSGLFATHATSRERGGAGRGAEPSSLRRTCRIQAGAVRDQVSGSAEMWLLLASNRRRPGCTIKEENASGLR
jgi:hypothetical protein